MANSPGPLRSREGGLLLIVAGAGLIALGWWGAMSVSTDLVRSFIASAATALALLLVNTGRRLMKAGAEIPLAGDAKPPIVYLRMFATDSRDPPIIPSRSFLGTMMTPTNEAQFRVASRGIAPFIAVGRPGERLEPLGADRVYLSPTTDWKTTVTEMVQLAELVIIRAGADSGGSEQSEGGLLWEISSVVAHVPPENVLVFLPYPARQSEKKRNAVYQTFSQSASGFFPNGLPSQIGKEMFIAFTSTWEPILLSRGNFPDEDSSDGPRSAFLASLYRNYQSKSFSVVRTLLLLIGLLLFVAIAIVVSIWLS